MAWVAFDRATKQIDAEGLTDESRRWHKLAGEIHAEICVRGFDRELNSFVQAYGSKRLDASLLLIPLVGFLPPSDPRVRGTLRAIEKNLLVDRNFVLRYETELSGNGLPPGEAPSLPAVSGSSTTTSCKVGFWTRAIFSTACSRAAMMSGCSRRNLIQ